MHEIRKQTEKEEVLVQGKIKLPKLFKVIDILCLVGGALNLLIGIFLFSLSSGDVSLTSDDLMGSFELAIGIVIFLMGVIFLSVHMKLIKKLQCVITNQRIYGKTSGPFGFGLKTYSYRLDRIDNVEMAQVFGLDAMKINFSNGNNTQTTVVMRTSGFGTGATVSSGNNFLVTCLANCDEMFAKVNELLLAIRNDTDLQVDIEMKKLEIENKKADAFMNMAGQTTVASPQSNFSALKELKSLLDDGIITQEEFDAKKKELLK